MKGSFKKHVEEVLEATTRILKQSNLLEHEEDEDNIADWQEIYASLIVTEKLMHQFPQSCLQTNLEVLLQYLSWEVSCGLSQAAVVSRLYCPFNLIHGCSWVYVLFIV